MLTHEALLAAGYKPFTQRNLKEFTNQFYQKRFDDELGKKYFITIASYDNRELIYERGLDMPEFSYAPETQFEAHGQTFDIELHRPENIEQMEAFFEKMWMAMNCDYYERNC